MTALVIAVEGECVLPLWESIRRYAPRLDYYRFDAITPADVAECEKEEGLPWCYPDYGTATLHGLICHAYKGDPMKRRAVFWSHYLAWDWCRQAEEPVCIFESDAIFIRPFDPAELNGCGFGMVGLNSPLGATRRAAEYHRSVQSQADAVCEVPWVDNHDVPQGTAGASAYWLSSAFAGELLAKVSEIGGWPNDSITIKQFFPGRIGTLKNYASKVSGRTSTLL